MNTTNPGHRIVIVGGGTAGVSVAARLRRAGQTDIVIVEPSDTHYYQPLWTLVGGGRANVGTTIRDERSVIPKGVEWVQDAVTAVDPEAQVVHTRGGREISYDRLVVCPGIQLDWDQIPGLSDTLGRNGVSSNYSADLAPKTWDMVSKLRKGTALFTMPSGPIKCGGAPQKAAYIACDYWRKAGVLKDIHVILAIPTPKIFGIPEYAEPLMKVIDRYGIDLRTESEVIEVNPDIREAIIINRATDQKYSVGYDFMHVVPPQSAPDWIKRSALAGDDPKGWISVDPATLQHTKYPTVFALGDVADCPTGKTGAAVRKQAPVVAHNVVSSLVGGPLAAEYHGYASCPIVTSRNRMLLCEFDYSMRPTPTIPFMKTPKERYSMWLLKKYGLPFLYWNFMLKGRA